MWQFGEFLCVGWGMLVEAKVSLGTELPVPLRRPGISNKTSLMVLPCPGLLLVSNLTHQLLR